MSEFINTADVIDDDAMCDLIIQRTVTEYKENRISKIGKAAFHSCISLTVVDVPEVTEIADAAMLGCSALETLILRSNTMVTMEKANALESSGIANGTGYIYVPDDLVAGYQSATNWSTYADQIRAIEQYSDIEEVKR